MYCYKSQKCLFGPPKAKFLGYCVSGIKALNSYKDNRKQRLENIDNFRLLIYQTINHSCHLLKGRT